MATLLLIYCLAIVFKVVDQSNPEASKTEPEKEYQSSEIPTTAIPASNTNKKNQPSVSESTKLESVTITETIPIEKGSSDNDKVSSQMIPIVKVVSVTKEDDSSEKIKKLKNFIEKKPYIKPKTELGPASISSTVHSILDNLKNKDLFQGKRPPEKDSAERINTKKTQIKKEPSEAKTQSSFDNSLDKKDDDILNDEDKEKSVLAKPEKTKKETYSNSNDGAESSHFFAYFVTVVILCIVAYIVFHNKQKIIAIVIEGRAKRNGRRPNCGNYKPLEANVEEMIGKIDTSTVTKKYIY